MHRHRGAYRGLATAVMVALGLWVFRGPMPDMVMGGMLTMTTAGGSPVAHAAASMPGHHMGPGSACRIDVGCCPGSSTPPPNPLVPSLSVLPASQQPAPVPPQQPERAAQHHWQPQPIGPPASFVS